MLWFTFKLIMRNNSNIIISINLSRALMLLLLSTLIVLFLNPYVSYYMYKSRYLLVDDKLNCHYQSLAKNYFFLNSKKTWMHVNFLDVTKFKMYVLFHTIPEVNYLLPVAWTSLKNSRTFHSGTPNFAHRNSIRSWIIGSTSFVLIVVPLWMEEWKSWKMPNKMTSNLIILQSQAKVNLHPQTQWLFMLLKSIFSEICVRPWVQVVAHQKKAGR